jgi:class 3 adenylate cyclase/TolB-like protein/tetratricopeptide (TPR) repeat protein
VERRLAAILAADVVGYSTMMGADEARALASIRLLREVLFEPEVARWRGVVVKRLGDGWLVEFPSVIDAVGCAVAVQNRIAEVQEVELRIGVHIGDIVHEGDDIYGDGVNIAARLEAAGAPGHVLISDDVRRQIAGRVDATFHEIGPVALKNIAEPVRVWSWPEALADLAIASDTGQKPSIHVAQFEARGAEAMELAEAVRDDLATAFARQSGVNVLTDTEAADYIVTGAIRGAGDRWRISASLTDRVNDQTVWSDRFDETGGDPFDIQDHCVTRIAGAVRIRLPSLLAGKLAEKPLQSMTVEELLNHAMNCNFTPTITSWDHADSALKLVLQRESDNWMAMTMLCWNMLARSLILGWRQIGAADAAVARGLIERAQTLKPNSEVVRMAQGALLLYVLRDHGAARIEAEESLRLNPDFYHAINLMSQIELFTGDLEKATELALRCVDCDPGYPYLHLYQRGAGYVYAVSGNYADAIDRFQRADRAAAGLPQNLIGIAASSQLDGDIAGARKAMASLLELEPSFNLEDCDPWPFRDPAGWTPFRNALAAASAPLQPLLREERNGVP